MQKIKYVSHIFTFFLICDLLYPSYLLQFFLKVYWVSQAAQQSN